MLFEVVSAFSTVGLSTGSTADPPVIGQLLLVALIFIGRLGPITLASALALREPRDSTNCRRSDPSLASWLHPRRDADQHGPADAVVVIGLGRFGSALALELVLVAGRIERAERFGRLR